MFWKSLLYVSLCTGPVQPLTVSAAVGVTVACIAVVIFIAVIVAAVVIYHCISKHHSQLNSASTSYQQQQTEYEEVQAAQEYEVPVTSGAEIELRENMAYGPVQPIELRENGPIQHWFATSLPTLLFRK